ncbi:hypothetical protein Tco_0776305 [Tanacetum coccineum]
MIINHQFTTTFILYNHPSLNWNAPTVNQQPQQPEFPQLDSGLTVSVFKQGDDPIDTINHMMPFLSAIVTSRYPISNNQGGKFILLRVLLGPTLQEQVEAILGNKGLFFVTTAKGKDTSPNNALNLKGKWMILESLKKYGMESCDPVDTPMVEKSKLDEDTQGKAVDPAHYRGMVGTLMYLTASRLDLTFVICMCARYQAKPTEKHLHDVKRIFKYLRGTVTRGLWYPKDSSIALTAYANADHAEQVENGVVELYFVDTKYQLADIFTKALGRERIEFLINKLGMRSFTPETLKQLVDDAEE